MARTFKRIRIAEPIQHYCGAFDVREPHEHEPSCPDCMRQRREDAAADARAYDCELESQSDWVERYLCQVEEEDHYSRHEPWSERYQENDADVSHCEHGS